MDAVAERRAYTRHSLEAPIMYIGHDSVRYYGARVRNYSKGGIGMDSAFALSPGSDISIKMKDYPPDIFDPKVYDGCRAEVVWCRERTGAQMFRYEIGAEYKDKFWKKAYDKGLTDVDPRMWETTYVDIIRPTINKFAQKPALTYMGTEITFAELDRYSNQFAHMLLARGFEKGDVLGINLPNIPEYIITWLGTLKAGCVVSGVSPLLSAEEMEYQLRDSNAKGLVTLDAIFAEKLVKVVSNLPSLQLVVIASVGGFLPLWKRALGKLVGKIPKGKVTPIEGKRICDLHDVITTGVFSEEHPDLELGPDDLAYIQYTGGTTGPPKGAMLSHRNTVSNLMIFSAWMGWEPGTGMALSGFPLFHGAGLFFNKCCVYFALTQVLIPNPRNTKHICSELARHRPRFLANVPSLYQLLLADPRFRTLDHSNLELCISGAAPFPEASQRDLEDMVGKNKLLEVYGMTETLPFISANPCRGEKKLGTVGLPILNTDVKLKDPATGRHVPQGEPGEICVKGPQVMLGYINKPEETNAVFDDEGYLHTGDVAILDRDGYLTIVDRTKDMIIVGGFKVFSQRVEEALMRHPAIDRIAIVGIPNPGRPGSEIVVAYLSLSRDFDFDGNEKALKDYILTFAREKLAPYEVPKRIEFREELPLTSLGKVDKKRLRKEACQ